MKRYVIEFAPNWCDGCLSYDTNAVSEEAALATIDRLLKENASIDLQDVLQSSFCSPNLYVHTTQHRLP